MDEPDTRLEPVDQAYADAEALLADDEARVRRRARVLGAVARIEPARARGRRSAPGGWLAAACVVALSLFVVVQIQQRPPSHAGAPPKAQIAQTGGAAATGAAPAPPPQAAASPSPAPSPPAAPRVLARAADAASAAADRPVAQSAAPASEKLAVGPSNSAAAKPAASADAGFAREEVRAAKEPSSDRASRSEGRLGGMVAPRPPPAPAAAIASPSDKADQLRAAAAAGRSDEVADLLAHGAPVDAQDDLGDTALMKSVRAGRIETSALLRRRGASLDRKNRAGLSVRDIAASLDDPRLDQAIGVEPHP
jgi:hypothetical protein